MIETVLALAVAAISLGLSFWALRVAFIAKVRNDLYSCREDLFDLVIDGEATFQEEPVKALAAFIHTLIFASNEFSFIAFVSENSRQKAEPPTFMADPRLKPIAVRACAAGVMGIFHSSILLKLLVWCIILVGTLYSPFRVLGERCQQESQNVVLGLAP